jgi:hypothetical protein
MDSLNMKESKLIEQAIEQATYRELFETALNMARRDSEATGDRYVPMGTFDGNWAVVDAWLSVIVLRGISFEIALNQAEELSKMQRVKDLENKGGE